MYGKEKRKRKAGKEGKLGVEGMTPAVLLEALRNAGALPEETAAASERITKTDLYLAGYSGTADCDARRKRLMQRLHLPEKLGANAFLEALNLMMTREEFLQYGENND